MDSPPASQPSQPSSRPSCPSWKRSEVYDLVPVLDDVVEVLRRIERVEQLRPTGLLARGAREEAEHARGHVHDLLRVLEHAGPDLTPAPTHRGEEGPASGV